MTDPVVDVVQVEPSLAAVRDGAATRQELAATILALLDDVWAHIRSAGDLTPGHNVVVYRGDPDLGPAPLEVGVQVGRRFEGPTATGVRCAELPSGRAARVTHRGPYDAMAPAYAALDRWARKGSYALAAVSWEVYGDWREDPAQLETDIYWLLDEATPTASAKNSSTA
jgi:effector-binding domain-containing protein